MKRLVQIVALVAITFFIPITVSMPVAAEPVCKIGFTGPNSENKCTSEAVYKCEVKSENNVDIDYVNEQIAASGTVIVEENGTGGGAVSGASSNESTVDFTVVIDNGNKAEPCLARVVVPAEENPVTPENPVTSEIPTKPTQEVTPKALPATSGSDTPTVLLVTSGVAAAVVLASAYRRLHL